MPYNAAVAASLGFHVPKYFTPQYDPRGDPGRYTNSDILLTPVVFVPLVAVKSCLAMPPNETSSFLTSDILKSLSHERFLVLIIVLPIDNSQPLF